jgi:hypothetical protein
MADLDFAEQLRRVPWTASWWNWVWKAPGS